MDIASLSLSLHAVEIWNLISRNTEIALIPFHHFQHFTYGHSPSLCLSLSLPLSLSSCSWNTESHIKKYGDSADTISPMDISPLSLPSISLTVSLHAVEIWNLISRNTEIVLILFHHFQHFTYGHSPSLSLSLPLSLMQLTVFMQLKYGMSYWEIWR